MGILNKHSTLISILLLIGLVYYSFYSLMPQRIVSVNANETAFSAKRAAIHLKEICKEKHPTGSKAIDDVREYLVGQLQELGLSPEIQERAASNIWNGSSITLKNIVARIKGTGGGKVLLILAHYDSDQDAYGAADDGSGIVTILESLRAYLALNRQSNNDIVILFTDGEEQGLLGAKLFAKSHRWAKDIGFAINFEGRGSGGPGFTLLETNGGNKNVIKAYANANLDYPVATSLFYSVYQYLPNDTDSRVFKEILGIDGLLFAFIDDFFDYHMPSDNFQNMDLNTIQHQGSYLLPLMNKFANTDLSKLKSDEDLVFFNFPFIGIITYPYKWVYPILAILIVSFILCLVYGLKFTCIINWKSILYGFVAFSLTLLICGLFGFYGWEFLIYFYPHYDATWQEFPENGYWYILFFALLSLSVIFQVYKRLCDRPSEIGSYLMGPLFLWIIFNIPIAIYLKGAGYFAIPAFFALINLFLLIKNNGSCSIYLNLLLSIPTIIVFTPYLKFFPVALGLSYIIITTVFVTMISGLLLPVFGNYKIKNSISLVCFSGAILSFIWAHFSF